MAVEVPLGALARRTVELGVRYERRTYNGQEGAVALWGDVVTDDHGLRGEFGYPSALSLVTADASPVRAILRSLP